MKHKTLNTVIVRVRVWVVAFILTVISLMLFSFSANKYYEDLFTQLGIEKTEADKKITNSILGGYLDTYGLKNVKQIASGNRAAVAKDLLDYTKKYTGTEAFKKEYIALKQSNKPAKYKFETPDEMRKNMIDQYRKSISEMEVSANKADASTKNIFENVLVESRKQLKDAEDPNNKLIANYTQNYPQLLESYQKAHDKQLEEWELKYPSHEMLFVKQRLISFMEETENIDFDAELALKNGKKIFVNPLYEHKSRYWKMAYRAGKEVVETSRAFAEQWIKEIK